MIENTEELQGQLVANGNIVASMVSQKGAKGDKGDTGNAATIAVGTVTTGSPGTQATVTNVGTNTDAIFDFVIPRGQDGSGGGGGGDMYKSTYDQNDNGIVDNAEKVNNHTVQSDVPANAVFTDTTYTAGTGIEITSGNVINNTQTSAEWGNISGTLADQNDLNTALGNKIDKSNTTGLVKNDGTIDTTTYSTFSGSYNDLSNKPTIPTVNNATLTIQKNSTTLDTFTANASVNKTIDIPVPTKVSDLNNDSGFITNSVNNLTNYTTTSTLTTLLAGKEKDIPIQDTAPQNPEEDDLWIDTSESSSATDIINVIFPIGSIVIKADNNDYSNWLGFTWERTLVGRVAVGIDSNDTDFDTIGETGGSKYLQKHKHTEIDWLADSNYPLSLNSGSTGGYAITNCTSGVGTGRIGTNDAGTGESGNLQPYQVVAYWKRTA